MKVFSVVLLGCCLLGVFSKRCKKEGGDGFFEMSIAPIPPPLNIGILWDADTHNEIHIADGDKCGVGETLIITSMKVFAKGPTKFFSWQGGLQSRFKVTTKNSNAKIKKASTGLFPTSCFQAANVKTNQRGVSVLISCMNFRKACKINYKYSYTCAPAGRRLLAANSSSTPGRALLTATGGEEAATGGEEAATGGEEAANEWTAACPVVTRFKTACGDTCRIEEVSDEDFEAVCNEYLTDQACKASITQTADVLDDYKYYCDPEPVFDGAGCLEFLRVNASCHADHGVDCSVDKVAASDFDAVCGEYRSVSECTSRVQEFPDYFSMYEEYCVTVDIEEVEGAAPSGAPTTVLGASLWVVGGVWAVTGF